MNETIRTMLSHRSIRKFKEEKLTQDQIGQLVQAAQAASTSSFMQPYTIIGVDKDELKQELAELSGNKHVAHNGHFFVFCLDFNRYRLGAALEGQSIEQYKTSIESTEWFMIGLIDTALAAQNLAIAAESMGFGICYIGGLRNNLEAVCNLLKTPDRVIPLFGMTVGYPDQDPDVKPRLPMENVYHHNTYQQDEEEFNQQLDSYNALMSDYYHERTGGRRSDRWTEQVVSKLKSGDRMYMKEFLKNKGLSLK